MCVFQWVICLFFIHNYLSYNAKHIFYFDIWQVYRGPNQGYGGKHGKFAPWGYYLTQPQDKKYGGGYH